MRRAQHSITFSEEEITEIISENEAQGFEIAVNNPDGLDFGEVVIHTGIFKWSDGSFRSYPEDTN